MTAQRANDGEFQIQHTELLVRVEISVSARRFERSLPLGLAHEQWEDPQCQHLLKDPPVWFQVVSERRCGSSTKRCMTGVLHNAMHVCAP